MSSDMLNDDWEHVIQCCLSEFAQQVCDEKQGVDPAVKREPQDPDDYLDKKLVENSDALFTDIASVTAKHAQKIPPRCGGQATQKGTNMLITCHNCGGHGHYQSICPTRTTQSATAGAALGVFHTLDDEDEESLL
ncbi:hypothetical protein BT96DRAFT_1002911 [Gymnopus androsaceus JB14]|uniref:CCHC-type domain-containing protein n=1 Tax=Gymnopus androsaceus JB14 TaxID=1447944 RepID=A0A6A4GXJ7_9AGAR|nr:hypothetical protein BT96DRAFT_1002911 [Gymnopus androsaceus JB14]